MCVDWHERPAAQEPFFPNRRRLGLTPSGSPFLPFITHSASGYVYSRITVRRALLTGTDNCGENEFRPTALTEAGSRRYSHRARKMG
jgi:hypothetical protein